MIFSKSFGFSIVLGLLFNNVSGTAYEININGQKIQVNVVSQGGEQYNDRLDLTDDYGDTLDSQPNAICSSLRVEQCEQVTNNLDKIPNLFHYFPTHESQSVIAQSNTKYNNNKSPYLLRQPMDDRILYALSRQNPHNLGTLPLKPPKKRNRASNVNNLAQQLSDPLKLVKTKRIKHKRKKRVNKNKDEKVNKNENDNEIENGNDNEEYEDVEVELYSTLDGDTELADALGMDEEELGDTVDRIVAQLVASYLDNDSDEVDVGQIFANEMSVENGDVSMEQINLDEGSMQEMSDLLTSIAKKHKKKENNNEEIVNRDSNSEGNDNEGREEAQVFALKFVVDSDDTNPDDNEQDNDQVEDINNNNNENQNENIEGEVF